MFGLKYIVYVTAHRLGDGRFDSIHAYRVAAIAAALERFLRSTPIYRAAHGAALGRSAIQLRPRATHREDLSPRWLASRRSDVTTPSASRQDHKVVRVQLAVLLLPLLRVREAHRVSRGSRGTGRRQAQGVAAAGVGR